jgi:hypothetical protein
MKKTEDEKSRDTVPLIYILYYRDYSGVEEIPAHGRPGPNGGAPVCPQPHRRLPI